MANRKHLEILKQGVEVWNKWRKENPKIRPDLIEARLRGEHLFKANLSGANLIRADLSRAYLRWADLGGADLGGADLSGANLSGADLSGANPSGANLSGANLRWADLRGTNLSEAKLDLANLSGANLSGAGLSGAIVLYTIFVNVDLSQTVGLEAVKHKGPSTIGIDTIYKSKGKIPESFLRGCGVPEDLIKLIPSLTSQPFNFYSCFISYSSNDDDFAHRFHADLQENKVRVWFAPEDMKIGDKIWDSLDQTIRVHDKLLLVLSEQSIESDWVEDEVTTAFEEERRRKKTVLFPIRLDDSVMDTKKPWAAKVRQRHIGDFTDWKNHDSYKKAFDRLLRDLKASEK
ncbi:MAG: toll/interleukin-1 receptor domain-containing protein [Desulfarculaceae bacterium]|nr:toll/interleukin-1 receptor domain-containing protein [Desulfarculaceae bacterium]MCF8071789.1 toll/interleukin-1 receptor domain-containing protein [Desulfarculaceae bacterium]MCF8101339.1 toll/interleukin-1 receptor domain-containing protein [Desulfarculaceae bacterium]